MMQIKKVCKELVNEIHENKNVFINMDKKEMIKKLNNQKASKGEYE